MGAASLDRDSLSDFDYEVNPVPSRVLVYEPENHVASITLNRPKEGNTIDQELAQDLVEVCRRADRDENVRVVLLCGAGDVFCLGAEDYSSARRVASTVSAVQKPVIACINGEALGQGLELALACDIRLATDNARFGLDHLALGSIPGDGGTQFLPQIVGKGIALGLLLTASTIDATEARRIGLVSKVVRPKDLTTEGRYLAQRMAAMAPLSLRFAKEAINKGVDMTLDQGLRLEADLYFLLHTTKDRTEGITSYLQKKMPRFEGR